MKYLSKLLLSILPFLLATLLIVLFFSGVCLAGNVGDTGVSYKNHTAYLVMVETAGSDDRTEYWVLKHGHSDDWIMVEKYIKHFNIMGLQIYLNHPDEGWISRKIIRLGSMGMDFPWIRVTDKVKSAEGLTDDMYMHFKYMHDDKYYKDFDFLGCNITQYKVHSRSFIEGIIMDMAWADYNEGQEGR